MSPSKPLDPELTQGDIDAFFDALLRELANLDWAVNQFGGDFDLDEWSGCFHSEEPADQARRSAVLFPFTNGFNCLNELLRRASWIKAGVEVDTPTDMKSMYTVLRQDGALSSGMEKVLHRLNSQARNALTHRYPNTHPRDLREAVQEFEALVPSVHSKLGKWLARKGFRLGPDASHRGAQS